MSSERPTVRPVTLARLVEVTHLCEENVRTTEEIAELLGVSRRRSRESILEALRIGLISEEDDDRYVVSSEGRRFVSSVRQEDWSGLGSILERRSPHYGMFLCAVNAIGPADLDAILVQLEDDVEDTGYAFNQTVVEVVGDWAERLGAVQRHAFSGKYYRIEDTGIPADFHQLLLSVFKETEERAGVNLRQRYLPIPKLRENVCERIGCTRSTFDATLIDLANQNVGRIELSGAPMDSGAKESILSIKRISLAEDGTLVSTDQSSDRVMAGVELYGKRYYYLAIHDESFEYTPTFE